MPTMAAARLQWKSALLFQATQKWFAVQVAAQCERKVSMVLSYKGYECFLPTYEGHRSSGRNAKSVELPLFPGYIFCKATAQVCGVIVTTPRVVRIVSFGGKPSQISDDEINAVRMVTRSGFRAVPFPHLTVGQRVRIETGPLSGLIGVLIQIQNQRRLVVSVDAVMKSISVDIDSATAVFAPVVGTAESSWAVTKRAATER